MKNHTRFRTIISKYLFKVAEATIEEIARKTPLEIQERAVCAVTPAEKNKEELSWSFYVVCSPPFGSGIRHFTQFQFEAKPNSTDLRDYNTYVNCDCGNYRWGGPGYNAHKGGYLLRFSPWATIPPNVRDPKRKHNICKHILACIDYIKARGLEIEGT